jgi:hypothetical protein
MKSMIQIICVCLVLFVSTACTTTFPNQDPTGLQFPDIKGESLEQNVVSIPSAFKGNQTLLLIGYVQNAQFDIDRWLIGLDMTQTDIAAYELPTIAGLFPQFFETQINNGMRKGIPKSLWKGVVTIFDDGELVQEFTGNQNPNNTRVVLLNKEGKITFFSDEGFSVAGLNSLREQILADSQPDNT